MYKNILFKSVIIKLNGKARMQNKEQYVYWLVTTKIPALHKSVI
jgi:hypothetical protein